MVSKIELQSVINKYYLNGLVEEVVWNINNDVLNIKFTAPTREMIGEIFYNKIGLENAKFGINNTTQLLKLIGITSSEILLSFIKNHKIFSKLIIADNKFTVNYSLADILTIPKAGSYNGSEEYDIEAELTPETISALIKAKTALSESTTVLLRPDMSLDGDQQLELIFGGDIEYANKVSYLIPNIKYNDKPTDFELAFSSDLLKEILSCNKDSIESKIYLSLEGLIKLCFKTETTSSTYYLVKKDM